MINILSSARRTLDARRVSNQQWSRLERELSGPWAPTDGLDVDSGFDRPDRDTTEMRRFLAAQTSQVV